MIASGGEIAPKEDNQMTNYRLDLEGYAGRFDRFATNTLEEARTIWSVKTRETLDKPNTSSAEYETMRGRKWGSWKLYKNNDFVKSGVFG